MLLAADYSVATSGLAHAVVESTSYIR